MRQRISLIGIFLLLLGAFLGLVWGQTQQIQFTAPPPSPVAGTSITAQRVGIAGTQTYYYWVVATYPIGNAFPAGPGKVVQAPDTLSVSNYVKISWNPVAGASSYDVLRTTTPTYPNGACSCKVGTATLGATTLNDQSNSLTSYTLVTAQSATGYIYLDNQTASTPQFIFSPGFTLAPPPGGGTVIINNVTIDNSTVNNTTINNSTINNTTVNNTTINNSFINNTIIQNTTLQTNITINNGKCNHCTVNGTAITNSYLNEGVTGTTLHKLAKLTGAPSKVIITTAGDTGGAMGVVDAGAGTTGTAEVTLQGTTTCIFDGATTAGNYVTISATVNGDCHDGGASYPSGTQVVGRVLETHGAGGTYSMSVFGPEFQSSTSSNTFGAVASLPATCSVGDTYRTSNSLYEYQCTALNTWTAFHNGMAVTPPPSAGWSWDNQGVSSTIDSTNGYQYAYFSVSAIVSARLRYRTASAAPYTIKYKVIVDLAADKNSAGGGGEQGFLIGFRESSTGKFVNLRIGQASGAVGFVVDKWTSTTAFSATYVSGYSGNLAVQSVYLKEYYGAIRDEGGAGNIIFYWSPDGFHYNTIFSVSRTNFMLTGPDQVLFGAYVNANSVVVAPVDWTEQAGTP